MAGHLGGVEVVSRRGKPTAVLIDLKTYRAIQERLEELEDALSLKQAVRTGRKFISHDELLRRLGHKVRV